MIRFPPLEGDVLYHGTSAEEYFEEDGEPPDGPAFFLQRVAFIPT